MLITLALVAGRIAVVRSPDGRTAFLSANDRSRWATVASLVEDGTYRIDRLVEITDPISRHVRPFDSIDKVMHVGTDGRRHSYSSKPPLLATMVAGVYWPLHRMTGLTLTRYPIYVPRMLLAVVNLPVLLLLCWATWRSIEAEVQDSWTRLWLALGICLGTMLTPMAVSLNNHLPAAAATAVVLWIYVGGTRHRGAVFLAGAAAALAVAFELPSLAMAGCWTVLFLRRRCLSFLAGAALVAAAFFGTNWIAHRSWRMPYAHRGEGEVIATVPTADWGDDLDRLVGEEVSVPGMGRMRIDRSDEMGRWRLVDGADWYGVGQVGREYEVRRWDDWYEYPGSYWQDGRRVGVDRGEPSRLVYAMHLLVGHHGVLSLTPVWWWWVPGCVVLWNARRWRGVMTAIVVVTCVCVAFYVARPLIDRNYGGVSSCFRWLLWMVPLWWFVAAAGVSRWTEADRHPSVGIWRLMSSGLLMASVFSVAIALDNPWVPPWIERAGRYFGWFGGGG